SLPGCSSSVLVGLTIPRPPCPTPRSSSTSGKSIKYDYLRRFLALVLQGYAGPTFEGTPYPTQRSTVKATFQGSGRSMQFHMWLGTARDRTRESIQQDRWDAVQRNLVHLVEGAVHGARNQALDPYPAHQFAHG